MRKRPTDRYHGPRARRGPRPLPRGRCARRPHAVGGSRRSKRRAALLGWVAAVAVGSATFLPRPGIQGHPPRTRSSRRPTRRQRRATRTAPCGSTRDAAAASPTPLASAVRMRAAEAEIPRASRLIEAGRAEEVLTRADGRLAALADTRRQAVEWGPLTWARGMALAALGRHDEALASFHAAADAASQVRWREAQERRGWAQADLTTEQNRWVEARKSEALRPSSSRPAAPCLARLAHADRLREPEDAMRGDPCGAPAGPPPDCAAEDPPLEDTAQQYHDRHAWFRSVAHASIGGRLRRRCCGWDPILPLRRVVRSLLSAATDLPIDFSESGGQSALGSRGCSPWWDLEACGPPRRRSLACDAAWRRRGADGPRSRVA
jgi:hypothetical protein